MDIQEKTRREEKRTHPFLFLFLLGVLALIISFFWYSWQERMQESQISNIIRSEDIDVLLHNSKVLSVVFQADQSNIVEQVLTLEEEIKQLYPQNKENSEKIIHEQYEQEHVEFELGNSLDPVDLALREIVLLQGENGSENFRLKAVWATLRQNSSLLSMYMPRLLYTPHQEEEKAIAQNAMQEPRQSGDEESINVLTLLESDHTKYMHATFAKNNFEIDTPKIIAIESDRGIIIENSQIFLKDNVFAKQNTNSIRGDSLNYDDEKKTATFPTLSHFQGENIKGNANILDWHLEENKIYGSQGVDMVWTPSS